MKILLFNKPYEICVNPANPCQQCVLNVDDTCSKISTAFCIEYGGFQPSSTTIFTL